MGDVINDKVTITIEECKAFYKKVYDTIQQVYSIFVDFYGEDRVDLQNINDEDIYLENIKKFTCSNQEITNNIFDHLSCIFPEFSYAKIYVHWPECIIENENKQSHLIKDLFAIIPVNYKGFINTGFKLTRSTFTQAEWNFDYAHSHICGVPAKQNVDSLDPCLGNGPIKNTISTLIINCDLNIWKLFCLELDMYVHTESISGTPYRYLSQIGYYTDCCFPAQKLNEITPYKYPIQSDYFAIDPEIRLYLNRFIAYLFKKKASYIQPVYCNKSGYVPCFNPYTDILKISDDFIEFANNLFININDLIREYIFNKEGTALIQTNIDDDRLDANLYENKYILTFKNKDVCLKINKEKNIKAFDFLRVDYILYILFEIENIYNCNLTFQTYAGRKEHIGKEPYQFI